MSFLSLLKKERKERGKKAIKKGEDLSNMDRGALGKATKLHTLLDCPTQRILFLGFVFVFLFFLKRSIKDTAETFSITLLIYTWREPG